MKKFSFWLIVLMLGGGLPCVPAQALALSAASQAGESAASFYKGKTVEFVVPYAPGGGYDTSARLLLPFLKKHLGGAIIVRNEPGAGAKVALNRLMKENNGLSLVTVAPRTTTVAQLFGEAGVRHDLTKFNWLGTMSREQYLIAMSRKSGYKSISDLQQAKEVKFGVLTRTSGEATRVLMMGHIFGVNVKLVAGYKGSAEEILALLRGEVDGLSIPLMNLLPHINSQDVIPLLAVDLARFKRLPTLPTIFEVKKLSAQEKRIADIGISLDAIGRPVATTPGVPKERVAFLESALKKALGEPELLRRFEQLTGEPIAYATGRETAKAINTMLSMSGDEKKLFGKLLGIEGY